MPSIRGTFHAALMDHYRAELLAEGNMRLVVGPAQSIALSISWSGFSQVATVHAICYLRGERVGVFNETLEDLPLLLDRCATRLAAAVEARSVRQPDTEQVD
jgi:hypothetical protein